MHYYGPGYMGGWWIIMVIGMVVFWGLIIAGLVLLIRYLAAQTPPRALAPGGTPVDILNRRMAAGEINMEEYESMRRKIEGTG